MRISDLSSDVCSSDLDPGRQTALELGELGAYAVDNLAGILALSHDDDAAGDLALAVELGDAAPCVGADLDRRDVAHRNRNAAACSAERNREIGRASCRERGGQYV